MTTTVTKLIDEVRALLNNGVRDVFSTMLNSETKPAPPRNLHASGETVVAGAVGFVGDVNGVIYVHITAGFARTLAGRLLGLDKGEAPDEGMVNDAIGELCNMIVGSVKSRLSDAGNPCVLTIPSIVRGQNFEIEPACSCERRLLGFRCGENDIVVELLIEHSKTL